MQDYNVRRTVADITAAMSHANNMSHVAKTLGKQLDAVKSTVVAAHNKVLDMYSQLEDRLEATRVNAARFEAVMQFATSQGLDVSIPAPSALTVDSIMKSVNTSTLPVSFMVEDNTKKQATDMFMITARFAMDMGLDVEHLLKVTHLMLCNSLCLSS